MSDFQQPYNPQGMQQFPRTPSVNPQEPQHFTQPAITSYAAGGTMVYLDNGELRPATLGEIGAYMRGAR